MIKLYYFPEFWILLIACLYMGTSIFLLILNMNKKDKEFMKWVDKNGEKMGVWENEKK